MSEQLLGRAIYGRLGIRKIVHRVLMDALVLTRVGEGVAVKDLEIFGSNTKMLSQALRVRNRCASFTPVCI